MSCCGATTALRGCLWPAREAIVREVRHTFITMKEADLLPPVAAPPGTPVSQMIRRTRPDLIDSRVDFVAWFAQWLTRWSFFAFPDPGYNKPKYRKRNIAFRGLLTCAHDHCLVTAEVKKEKYVYYRCSGGRGPCALPRFREPEIAERLGHVLQDVHVPPNVAQRIEASLQRAQADNGGVTAREGARLTRELDTLHRRMDAAYMDKLNGTITEDFWQRIQADFQKDELRIKGQIAGLKETDQEARMPTVRRILELAQNAHSLYVMKNPTEQADLLRNVLLNCSIDAVSLYPTYRKPFDLIAGRVKNQKWSGREDLNLRPPGPEPRKCKLQVLCLVSLREPKAILSSPSIVPKLYRDFCGRRDGLSLIHHDFAGLLLQGRFSRCDGILRVENGEVGQIYGQRATRRSGTDFRRDADFSVVIRQRLFNRELPCARARRSRPETCRSSLPDGEDRRLIWDPLFQAGGSSQRRIDESGCPKSRS